MDIMVDIETFGTGDNAAIVSIGAVAFEPTKTSIDISDTQTFHEGISGDSPARELGILDAGAVKFWLGQEDDAREALLRMMNQGRTAFETLHAFGKFLRTHKGSFWSNGPLFDERILRQAFVRCELEFPSHYRASRCFRTITDAAATRAGVKRLELPGTESMDCGPKHDGLADAIRQARLVQIAYETLGICVPCSS